MGERASFHISVYNTVRKSPQRHASTFKSRINRFAGPDTCDIRSHFRAPSAPGFLETQETPRLTPSIYHALTRPATSINGADNMRQYHSTFKTTYEFPKNIEVPINGGGIHALFDRKTGKDKFGSYLIQEHSIAQTLERTPIDYSVFKSPLLDHAIHKETKIDYRSPEYDLAHPESIERRVKTSLNAYSVMTAKSDKYRAAGSMPVPKGATDDIQHTYDVAHSSFPDLAVLVERSPIKFSAFNATTTHPHNVGKTLSKSQQPVYQEMTSQDLVNICYEQVGSVKRIHCPKWPKAARFLPDGHPLSMVPARVCQNDLYDASHGTIAREIEETPVRVKTMSAVTSRTSAVDLCYNTRPGSKLFVTRSKTEWYDEADKALPAGRMPIADRIASTPQTYSSSLASQSKRSELPPSLDPRQTAQHERRRQHILESHIHHIRNGDRPKVSAKMARILNLEATQENKQLTVSSEGDRLTLQQQSQDLHAWLTGSVGRTSAHKHRVVVSPDSKGTKAMIGMEKSYAD